jgi:hypothetical protein
VCERHFSSLQEYNAHCATKRHRRRLVTADRKRRQRAGAGPGYKYRYKETYCRHCKRKFENTDQYLSHHCTDHSELLKPPTKSYICELCKLACSSNATLLRHQQCRLHRSNLAAASASAAAEAAPIDSKHSVATVTEHICWACEFSFPTLQGYVQHCASLEHFEQLNKHCFSCRVRFPKRKAYLAHTESHEHKIARPIDKSPSVQWPCFAATCVHCNLDCGTLFQYQAHLLDPPPHSFVFHCLRCSSATTSLEEYTKHVFELHSKVVNNDPTLTTAADAMAALPSTKRTPSSSIPSPAVTSAKRFDTNPKPVPLPALHATSGCASSVADQANLDIKHVHPASSQAVRAALSAVIAANEVAAAASAVSVGGVSAVSGESKADMWSQRWAHAFRHRACSLCRVQCASEQEYEAHVLGQKHWAEEQLSGVASEWGGCLRCGQCGVNCESVFLYRQHGSCTHPPLSIHFSLTTRRGSSPECLVCDLKFETTEALETHLYGQSGQRKELPVLPFKRLGFRKMPKSPKPSETFSVMCGLITIRTHLICSFFPHRPLR